MDGQGVTHLTVHYPLLARLLYKYFSPLEVYWTINSVSLCMLYYMLVTEKYFCMIQEQYEASLQKRGITMYDYIEAMVEMKQVD